MGSIIVSWRIKNIKKNPNIHGGLQAHLLQLRRARMYHRGEKNADHITRGPQPVFSENHQRTGGSEKLHLPERPDRSGSL
jgi:hypothetical protein